MAEETVDTLELEIRARATSAAETVASLAASVSDFGKTVAQHIGNLSNLADVMTRIAESANALSKVKNVRTVISGAAMAAGRVKEATVGKAFKPIIPPVRASNTVSGSNRVVRMSDGSVRRYHETADQIARSVNRENAGTSYNNKELSAEIQAIRKLAIGGKNAEAMKATMELSRELASSVGAKNIHPLLQLLNSEFGGGHVGLTDKDIAGIGIGTKKLSSEIRGMGGHFDFQMRRPGALKNHTLRSFDEIDEEIYRGAGVKDVRPETIIGELMSSQWSGHKTQLSEMRAENDEQAYRQIFDGLVDRIFGSAAVEAKSEAEASSRKVVDDVKEEVKSAVESIGGRQFFDTFNRKLGIGAGSTSAKDSATVFEKLFDTEGVKEEAATWKDDVQEEVKSAVESIGGRQFFDTFNRRLGIGAGTTSAKESASVFEKQFDAEKVKEEAEAWKDIDKEVDAAWKSFDAWNREQDKYYREDYGGKNKKDQMNLEWKALEAERGAGQYNVDNTAKEIEEWKKLEDEIDAAKEAKKEYYLSEETKAASEAENERLRSTSRETLENIKAWNLAKNEGKAAEEQEALLRRTLSDNTPENIARAVRAVGVEKYQDITNNKIPEIADRGVEAGLITPEIAQAMKEAAGYAGDIQRESAMTAERFMQENSQADILQMKLDGVKQKLDEALTAGDQDPAKIARLAEQYQKLSDKIREVGEAADESKSSGITMHSIFSAIGKTLNKSLAGQLFRVARMRALRAVVKGVASAVKEGTNNLYQWSKALNGGFASSLDTIASKTMLAKNSIATAFAPAIQAAVPLISTLVSWVNAASNAIAQFFATLTGAKTWTRAVETVEEWGAAAKKSTSGASKGVKDLLADWDELNIIQSETGSGGGSGTKKKATDFSKMFEETDKFDDWLRYFDEIKNTVIAIGAGIAGWFVVSGIENFIDKLGIANDKATSVFRNIKKLFAGGVLLSVGISLSSIAGKDVANNGFSAANIIAGVGGMLSSALGGRFIGNVIGGLFGNAALGGFLGSVVGLAISLIVGVYSYYQEKNDNAKEFIRKNLESKVYGFDVLAEVEKLDVIIKDAKSANDAVRNSLSNVLYTMNVIKLGVDPNAYKTLYNSITGPNGLLPNLQKSLEEEKNVIQFYYQLKEKTGAGLNATNADGSYVNLDSFKLDMKATAWLEGEYTRIGQQFADCFVEGEIGKIKEGKEKLALELATQLAEAASAAERARGEAEIEVAMINELKGTDKNTVMRNMSGVIDEANKKLAELERNATEQYIISQSSVLAELKAMGADETLIGGIEKNIQEAKDRLANTDFKMEIELEYKEKNAAFVRDFIQKNYEKLGILELNPKEPWESVNAHYGLGPNDTLFSDLGIGLEELLTPEALAFLKRSVISNSVEDPEEIFENSFGISREKYEKIPEIGNTQPYINESSIEKMAEEVGTESAESIADAVEDLPSDLNDEFKETTNELKDTANEWFDTYKEILREQYQNGGDPDKSVLDDEENKFNAMTEAWGDEFDGFYNTLEEFIEGLSSPWDEEDIPDWVFDNTSANAGAATGWYGGVPDESFELDTSMAGLATDENVDSLAESTAQGMGSIESVLNLMRTAMANIEEYARQTAGKDLTVVVNPTSMRGRLNQIANDMFNAVTGQGG